MVFPAQVKWKLDVSNLKPLSRSLCTMCTDGASLTCFSKNIILCDSSNDLYSVSVSTLDMYTKSCQFTVIFLQALMFWFSPIFFITQILFHFKLN